MKPSPQESFLLLANAATDDITFKYEKDDNGDLWLVAEKSIAHEEKEVSVSWSVVINMQWPMYRLAAVLKTSIIEVRNEALHIKAFYEQEGRPHDDKRIRPGNEETPKEVRPRKDPKGVRKPDLASDQDQARSVHSDESSDADGQAAES